MIIMLVLIPITFVLLLVAGWAFFWAVNHDQFDDMDGASLLPLTDHGKATGTAATDDSESPTNRQP